MARKIRHADELRKFFDEEPELETLFTELGKIDGLSIEASGTGRSVFKVFLSDRTGQYEAFLWVYRSFDGYVQWERQRDHVETCRQVWSSAVKDPQNPNGSDLQEGMSGGALLRLSKAYVKEVLLKS